MWVREDLVGLFAVIGTFVSIILAILTIPLKQWIVSWIFFIFFLDFVYMVPIRMEPWLYCPRCMLLNIVLEEWAVNELRKLYNEFVVKRGRTKIFKLSFHFEVLAFVVTAVVSLVLLLFDPTFFMEEVSLITGATLIILMFLPFIIFTCHYLLLKDYYKAIKLFKKKNNLDI